LAIRNINQKRGSAQGQGTYRWTEALNAFAIQFPTASHYDNPLNTNGHNYLHSYLDKPRERYRNYLQRSQLTGLRRSQRAARRSEWT
uniref:hypothetical protein n=1 Tax=Mycobacterium avium TaxID=1764 RepID=UPI0012DA5AA0